MPAGADRLRESGVSVHAARACASVRMGAYARVLKRRREPGKVTEAMGLRIWS